MLVSPTNLGDCNEGRAGGGGGGQQTGRERSAGKADRNDSSRSGSGGTAFTFSSPLEIVSAISCRERRSGFGYEVLRAGTKRHTNYVIIARACDQRQSALRTRSSSWKLIEIAVNTQASGASVLRRRTVSVSLIKGVSQRGGGGRRQWVGRECSAGKADCNDSSRSGSGGTADTYGSATEVERAVERRGALRSW